LNLNMRCIYAIKKACENGHLTFIVFRIPPVLPNIINLRKPDKQKCYIKFPNNVYIIE
jgi:hypothetical protein